MKGKKRRDSSYLLRIGLLIIVIFILAYMNYLLIDEKHIEIYLVSYNRDRGELRLRLHNLLNQSIEIKGIYTVSGRDFSLQEVGDLIPIGFGPLEEKTLVYDLSQVQGERILVRAQLFGRIGAMGRYRKLIDRTYDAQVEASLP